ncbi:pimeloyl-ACP methyl ester carboxylesterase [Roseibium hamelinense]|uniref:Pimeloyl-ACP methyl ester carboxylesterase n=1 Tax=Roseibium hamelinense TaxID=150831 RepID=A0A562SGP2_9HYPH|nr:alpha/beta fold hydrolase [Roseibium hamelinense]MTI42854.1 alpha/beta fold hydrolase [Roseibium hamelinense]TWI79886.1 pimeloyl-ACP methyl ester carboxylesterase [Roseibium hamelinense]
MSGNYHPIVFVPGLLCTEAVFAPQIASLADTPIMVANHSRHETISDIARDILNSAPAEFTLVGLSMGGYIAMDILRTAPQRVSKLILMDTNARPDTADQTKRREFLIGLTQKKGFHKVPHLLYPGFVHKSREEDFTLRQTVVNMAMDTGSEAFIRQKRAIIARPDSRPHLPAIKCPTLIIVGDGDTLTPPQLAEEIHGLIPGSQLTLIENSGHLPTLEQPEHTTTVVRNWLGF